MMMTVLEEVSASIILEPSTSEPSIIHQLSDLFTSHHRDRHIFHGDDNDNDDDDDDDEVDDDGDDDLGKGMPETPHDIL